MDSQQLDLSVIRPYTRASDERLMGFARTLAKIDDSGIEGDVVECGVWKGGHVIMARLLSPERVCWLYDTFQGMTEPGPYDVKVSGSSKTAMASYQKKLLSGSKWLEASYEQVCDNLINTGTMDRDYLRFVVGDVRKTLLDGTLLPQRIALLRLDTDFYDSTKIELEVLYPRVVPGGVLIVDDYGHWAGARKAFNDYFVGKMIQFEKIDYTAVMVVK